MTQLNFSADTAIKPPPLGKIANGQISAEIPLLTEFKNAYLIWHNYFSSLPRLTRYTLGAKIDNCFLELLEKTLIAQFSKKENKFIVLNELSNKLDNLKFFLTLLWETKGMNTNTYTQLSQKLINSGKMLGKWLSLFKKATPPAEAEGE